MRGVQGLIVAIGLAIAGALSNWFYLSQQDNKMELVYFIGVNPEARVAKGERIRDSHLVPVSIPRASASRLKDFAYFYDEREAVIGYASWRDLEGGNLLWRSDLKSPPTELTNFEGAPEEKPQEVEYRAMGVSIDATKLVPALVQPGDLVSFIASKDMFGGMNVGEDAAFRDPNAEENPDAPAPKAAPRSAKMNLAGGVTLIGPFKILSLGNRLSSSDVMKSAHVPQVQENVMMISVRVERGQLEPKAQALLAAVEQSQGRPMGYLLHPRPDKKTSP